MRITTAVCAALTALASTCHASSLTPPVLPLTVRNPYFSTWLPNAREEPWTRWPFFWTGQELGFAIMAAVPDSNTAYPLLGKPQDFLDHESKDYSISYPKWIGSQYDASTTNLTYQIPSTKKAGKIDIVVSFLSPVTPTSTLRQSLPASYLNVYVEGANDVSIYVDVNGQWVSGEPKNNITWESFNMGGSKDHPTLRTFKVQRAQELEFTEINDRAEWGSLYFTAPHDVDYQIGDSRAVRKHFAKHSTLENTLDSNFRSIWHNEPIFAFSKTFKLANATAKSSSASVHDSVMFTLAHVQQPVVQFAAARGLTFMRPLWESWLFNPVRMLIFHYFDFKNAAKLADEYNVQLTKDAFKSGAADYVDIVTLSARQVLGGTSFSGTPDNPILFLKEISSDGNSQTIDVIFPSFPFFMYTNPRWLAYMLEPLIEHMNSGQYPNKYAMHDLGASFPNITGHPDGNDEYMPLEECGDILIMGLSLVNSLLYDTFLGADSSMLSSSPFQINENTAFDEDPESSAFALTSLGIQDGIDYIDDSWGGSVKGQRQAQKWVERAYGLWKQWTGYLEEFALEPHNQLSTDDFAGWLPLQTNLAYKGILGIKAMSQISAVVNKADDAKHFLNVSDTYLKKWEEYGMSRDGTHAKLAYNWYGSWTTLYNLYADSLLCFHLENTDLEIKSLPMYAANLQARVESFEDATSPSKRNTSEPGFTPRRIYTAQSDWYMQVRQKYGLPLDSRHLQTKTDWEFFAMSVASNKTRSTILESVARWVNETVTDRPLTDLHETEGHGEFPGPSFFNRPVVGGHFAFLSLERACGGYAMEGLKFLEEHEDAKELAEGKHAPHTHVTGGSHSEQVVMEL